MGEEVILFHTENRQFVSLNESAADIWRLCIGEFTLDGIVKRIASFYDVDPSDVREDVISAVDEFVEADLIHPVSSTKT